MDRKGPPHSEILTWRSPKKPSAPSCRTWENSGEGCLRSICTPGPRLSLTSSKPHTGSSLRWPTATAVWRDRRCWRFQPRWCGHCDTSLKMSSAKNIQHLTNSLNFTTPKNITPALPLNKVPFQRWVRWILHQWLHILEKRSCFSSGPLWWRRFSMSLLQENSFLRNVLYPWGSMKASKSKKEGGFARQWLLNSCPNWLCAFEVKLCSFQPQVAVFFSLTT